MAKDAPTVEDKTPPADTAGDATEQPSGDQASNEEAFAEAFEEFAAADDTVTDTLPADEKADATASAAETEDKPASGEEPPDPDEAASDAAAEDKTPDIWATATPEQKAAFEAAEHQNNSHKNRASAQNRKIAELLAARTSAPKPAAEPAAEATAATDEDWKQFKEDYPEVAGPMEKRFEERMARLEAESTAMKGQVTGITDAQAQDAINAEEALLEQRHPDWGQLTASPEFVAWLPNQPRYVQEGLARNGAAIIDGQEAASLIDLFKDSQPPASETPEADTKTPKNNTNGKATRRERRLESAVTTERGQAGPGAGPPEGDFDAAFDHFAGQP